MKVLAWIKANRLLAVGLVVVLAGIILQVVSGTVSSRQEIYGIFPAAPMPGEIIFSSSPTPGQLIGWMIAAVGLVSLAFGVGRRVGERRRG